MHRFIIYTQNKLQRAALLFRSRCGGMYVDFIMKMVIIAASGALVTLILSPTLENIIYNSKNKVDENLIKLGFYEIYFKI